MSAIGNCVVILPVEALEAAHAFYRRGMAEITADQIVVFVVN
jgi:hypothetical protein